MVRVEACRIPMGASSPRQPLDDAPMTDHVHHWILARDTVSNVPGECACGARRVFAGGDPATIDRPLSNKARQFKPGNDMQSRRRGAAKGGLATGKKMREARDAA